MEAYQSTTVPVGEVALNVTVPAAHLEPLVTRGASGNAIKVAVTATLLEAKQP